MRKLLAFVIIAGIAGLLGWQIYQRIVETSGGPPEAGGRNPGGRPGGAAAVAVEIADVRQQTIQDVGQFTGSLLPKSQFIVTSNVTGQIKQLLAGIGDQVKQGQLIVRLDDELFQQQVEKAQADLEVAKANLVESESALLVAQRELERSQTLFQNKVLSQSKLDAAEADYNAALARQKVAQATVNSRDASLKTAQSSLSYTRIKATWNSGSNIRVVGERFVDEGTILRANEPIVSLLDISAITCVIYVIEKDYVRVRQGQQAVIITDAFPGQTFTGQITRIAPILKETSRQAQVEIEIPNPDAILKPGMFVRVRLEFDEIPNATVVPVTAIVKREEQQGVFLVDPEKLTARFVPVTVGVTSNGLAQIVEPPLSGAVVTLGHHLLEDGASILLPQQQQQKE